MSAASGKKAFVLKSTPQGKHRLTLYAIGVFGLCFAVMFATYMFMVKAPPPRKLVIATGSKSGAYHRFAQKYAEELAKEGVTLEIRETAGSVENLKLLNDDDSGVSIAIVQSGVAGPEDREKLQSLGSLYREPLWIFYRGDQPLERLSQLTGKHVNIGPPGSGTYAIAMTLLRDNRLVDTEGNKSNDKFQREEYKVADAAAALQKGELDAGFFVSSIEAELIKKMLMDPNMKLMNVVQHEAYHRKYRHLSQVTVPAGLADLGENIPAKDVSLLAPTATIVTRKDLHPALIPLLLAAASRTHSQGDELSNPGEFPSEAYTDLAVSEDAKMYYKSGPPVLQRFFPFWLASLIDRLKVMLLPLIMLLLPLFRAAPPLVQWRTRRKIYVWYSEIRDIDQKLVMGLSGDALAHELNRLRDIDQQVTFVDVPLSHMDNLYHLRLHLLMLQERLLQRQREEAGEISTPDPTVLQARISDPSEASSDMLEMLSRRRLGS